MYDNYTASKSETERSIKSWKSGSDYSKSEIFTSDKESFNVITPSTGKVNFWVVLIDRHEKQTYFIDPNTGSSSLAHLSKHRYQGIESVWNDTNYWVNIQSPDSHIDIDISNSLHWEPVFKEDNNIVLQHFVDNLFNADICEQICTGIMGHIYNPYLNLKENPSHPLGQIGVQSCEASNDMDYLTKSNHIHRSQYKQEKHFDGDRVRQRFAVNSRSDGLIKRIAMVSPFDDLLEEHLDYNDRRRQSIDRLFHVKRGIQTDNTYVEYFREGRSDGMLSRCMQVKRDPVDTCCTMTFQDTARLDSLEYRDFKPDCWMIEIFGKTRFDGLVNRHVKLLPPSESPFPHQVELIVDCYRQTDKHINSAIELIMYDLRQNCITICRPHRKSEEITPKIDVYKLVKNDWSNTDLAIDTVEILWTGHRLHEKCPIQSQSNEMFHMQNTALQEYLRSYEDHSRICRSRKAELRSFCPLIVYQDNERSLQPLMEGISQSYQDHCEMRAALIKHWTSSEQTEKWKTQCADNYRKTCLLDLMNYSEKWKHLRSREYVQSVAFDAWAQAI